MATDDSTAKIAGHPIHPMLVNFPIAAFVGTLVSDIAFLSTSNVFWATASQWLLLAGLVMAALAAVAGLVDFLTSARIRSIRAAWIHGIGNVIVVCLELWNYTIRGEPSAVRSPGIYLSTASVLILLVTGWMGWEMVYKHKVAVSD
jgi:uncharacterized membrane protein